MNVSLDDREIGLRWTVVRGQDHEAFLALGTHAAADGRAHRDPAAAARLGNHVSRSPGTDRLDAVRQAWLAHSL
jgi:hypothetical protein